MGSKYRQKPLRDAPPANAIAATAPRKVAIWMSLAFMSRLLATSPWLRNPAARSSSFRSPCLERHRNRPDLRRSVALVARLRPKCPIQAERRRIPSVYLDPPVPEYQDVAGL